MSLVYSHVTKSFKSLYSLGFLLSILSSVFCLDFRSGYVFFRTVTCDTVAYGTPHFLSNASQQLTKEKATLDACLLMKAESWAAGISIVEACSSSSISSSGHFLMGIPS